MVFFSHRNTNERDIKKNGSCLRINIKEDPSSLDPRRGRNMSGSSQLQAMLFEGLMRYELDGSLSCAQASSYNISSNQKIYTFYLKDTFWSDGTAVTAYDFEKTWKTILDPSFFSLDTHVLFCVKNAQAAKRGELPLSEVGIHVKDDKTLIIELEYPTLRFLQITAASILFPINHIQEKRCPKWHLEGGENFICNGQFKLSIWKHNQEMLLEKNKYYYRANKIKFNSIHISMINNGIAISSVHDTGLFDLVGLPFSPLPFDLSRALIQKKLLHIVKTPGTMACMFNTKKFPFQNVNMRKAFSFAINRQLIVDTITLLKEHPALGIIPPMLKKSAAKPFFKDNNIDEARACFQKGLEELGIQAADLNGKIAFSFWKQDYGCPLLPQTLQQQWLDNLGVKVELEALDFKTLHEKGQSGHFSISYFVFLAMCTDPIDLLDRFKYAHSPRNYARWQNNTYIDLLDRADRSCTEVEHFDLLDKAEEVLMDDMPFTPLFHWNNALLVQPYVKGIAVSPLGYLYLDRISLKKRS